jgi:asparagine N-glycosylation enzyme membrane subunit Stt3
MWSSLARASAWLLGLALLALTFEQRLRLAPGHQLTEPGDPPGQPRILVDDPDAAYHLRRVQVALSSGRVPSFDSLLNHPQGSAVPWPSFFDRFLARWVQWRAPRVVSSAIGPYEEAAIERSLATLPPLLGTLTALLVALAAAVCTGSAAVAPVRLAAALLALALYSCAPISIWYGGFARIDHHVLSGLLLAGSLAAGALALRSREFSTQLGAAGLLGLCLGLGLLTFLGSAVSVAGIGLTLFLRAATADGQSARGARLGGVLCFAVAALVVGPAAIASPWNQIQPGSLINLSLGVPRALLAACLPFVILELAARRGVARQLAWPISLLLTLLLALLLPGFLDGARAGFAWASRQNQFMDVVEESRPLLARGWSGIWRDLGAGALLTPLLVLGLLWRWRSPLAWLLLPQLLVHGGLTLTQRRFGDCFVVPLAITLGWLVASSAAQWWRAGEPRLVRRVASGLCWLLPTALIGLTAVGERLSRPTAAEVADLADWRRERLNGLRSLRDGADVRAYLDPYANHASGVLSAWGYGHLIEYHAWRPSIATNFGSFVGERNFSLHAAALLEADSADFHTRLDALSADWIVVTPRQCSELPSLARIAGWSQAQRGSLFERGARGKSFSARGLASSLLRLALHDHPLGTRLFEVAPGSYLELVYAAPRFEFVDGRRAPQGGAGAGPVISIWRRIAAPRGPGLPDAQLRAGPAR